MAWEIKKNPTTWIFVFVSGGYVVFGNRDKATTSTSEYCSIEDFIIKGTLQQSIIQDFGQATFKEIYDKVLKIHSLRNQKTSSPQASYHSHYSNNNNSNNNNNNNDWTINVFKSILLHMHCNSVNTNK
ncbi:hypothetical protein PPL_11486 [Heterostelium album PN500]|uniref:Uncharacterized protein n=1 Tax=Heterostelium pallidum (strain ATCC 26659 / Pp 5 / PN500) TaxID=670386 RepID=D3BTJ0_HETP5|nr:hypothetical protein PPL_11486 [Heterostelium album PN500]EFA75407.1 hypothetical protein PPL_11486 [Heterostelium album PN500]|eukprot:XP_020427541.1 hypothetical protein PPL_11486 [Heterostelium album PN500]